MELSREQCRELHLFAENGRELHPNISNYLTLVDDIVLRRLRNLTVDL